MRIVWVTRSFLDYRVPVFVKLNAIVNENLYLIFSGDYVPSRVQLKTKTILGKRAIALKGEWKIGPEDRHSLANKNVSIRFHPELLSKIRALKPDVLICDGFFKWTLPCLLYKLFSNVPIVVNYERTLHTERNAQWYRTLYRKLAIKSIDAMNCSGSQCQDYIQSLGMSISRIKTGHMVADIQKFSLSKWHLDDADTLKLRHRFRVEGVLFLYVGSLSLRKGCRKLLKAWSLFEHKHPKQGTLMLIGTGDDETMLKSICLENGLQQIRFAGAIDYDKLPLLYASANVFIIPTLEDNWSLVVPEAMASGLPILCSKYNGCWPEMISEGKIDWVFDPLQPQDIFRVLELSLCNKSRLITMGEESKKIVASFTPETAAKSIKKTCQLAINKK